MLLRDEMIDHRLRTDCRILTARRLVEEDSRGSCWISPGLRILSVLVSEYSAIRRGQEDMVSSRRLCDGTCENVLETLKSIEDVTGHTGDRQMTVVKSSNSLLRTQPCWLSLSLSLSLSVEDRNMMERTNVEVTVPTHIVDMLVQVESLIKRHSETCDVFRESYWCLSGGYWNDLSDWLRSWRRSKQRSQTCPD